MRLTPLAIYVVVTCLVAGSGFVAAAHAGTAQLRMVEAADQTWAKFAYRAAPGERNRPQVGFDASPDGSYPILDDPTDGYPPTAEAILVTDAINDYGPAPMVPGPGCAHHSSAPEWLRCPLPPGTVLRAPRISLGDRSDSLSWSLPGSHIFAGPGHDRVEVTRTAGLQVHGGAGNDTLDVYGRSQLRGRIALFGGEGRDVFWGSEGPDLIVPGRGIDSVEPSGGADLIRTADGRLEESIDCGPGKDILIADGIDLPVDCEQIRRRGAARAIPVGATAYTDEDLIELLVQCPSDISGRCLGDASITVGRGTSRGGRRRLGFQRLNSRPDGLAHLYFKVPLRRSLPRFPRLRVTVRTRDRSRALRTITRTLEADVQTGESE